MTDQKDQNIKPKKTDNNSQKVIDSFLNKDNNYVRIFLNITIFYINDSKKASHRFVKVLKNISCQSMTTARAKTIDGTNGNDLSAILLERKSAFFHKIRF